MRDLIARLVTRPCLDRSDGSVVVVDPITRTAVFLEMSHDAPSDVTFERTKNAILTMIENAQ